MKISYLWKDYIVLLIAFLVSVLIRVPNLNRPLSKHHEFNTAVILNGTLSWLEAGGASTFHYVPLMTYQGTENRLLTVGVNTDSAGNQVYLSLGAGWYVLPYLVFRTLHVTPTPLALQIINLGIHLLLIVLLYRMLRVVAARYSFLSPLFALWCCLVLLFLPGPLWYFGNGYVHAAVSLPFAILLFTQFLQYTFFQQKVNARFIIPFFLAGIIAIYIDWFMFFLLGVLAAYSLIQFFRTKTVSWMKISVLCGCTAIAGVALIFIQFAGLLGWHTVAQYWKERSATRSFNTENSSLIGHVVSLIANVVSCAGIGVAGAIAVVWVYLKNRKIAFPALPCLLLALACICYNGFFFNWSYVHEFSMVPVSILFSMLTGFFLLQLLPANRSAIALAVCIVLSITQYYLINPPGKISRVGTPYATQMQMGQQIKAATPAGYRVFSNLNNDPVVEYYAHCSFTTNPVSNKAMAQQLCDRLHIEKAVWVDADVNGIKEIAVLKSSKKEKVKRKK